MVNAITNVLLTETEHLIEKYKIHGDVLLTGPHFKISGGWGGALLQPYELVVWKGGQKVLGGEGDEVWESGKEKQLRWVMEVEGVVEVGQLSMGGELQAEERCELLVQVGDEVG